ncbi:thiamine diphosphokinase [Paenibacillus sp. 481]|uniref:thiamine diphosphokinase n=1 Tax=Paenibacillus sp. 481 TaxID=2835869 RepID=UPI001E58B241|nr:thiamine diphosphokinase [Paenibacillus sp. 481]UHA73116.1 thiamine diphosphokinase [Paenibacillus sp. 481]
MLESSKSQKQDNYNHIVIFAGGQLHTELILYTDSADFIIGADRGALFLISHGIIPDLAIGDFDSVTDEERALVESTSKRYVGCDAVDKNYTDTELAFQTALSYKPDLITICGATGTRLDHTLANIHLLRQAVEANIMCRIADNNNLIMLTKKEIVVSAQHLQHFKYVSLLPLSMEVRGITLSGFAYPLQDATLQIGQSVGISNELVAATGSIRIVSGYLLVICSRD